MALFLVLKNEKTKAIMSDLFFLVSKICIYTGQIAKFRVEIGPQYTKVLYLRLREAYVLTFADLAFPLG